MPGIIIPLLCTVLYTGIILTCGLTCLYLILIIDGPSDVYPIHALVPTGFLLGQGILCQIWLFLGLSSRFTQGAIWIVLIASLIIGLYSLTKVPRRLSEEIKRVSSQLSEISLFWKILCALITILLLLLGMEAIMLPPMGDAEAFYMVLPKIMASSGSLKPQPNYHDFSQIGLFGELHYAALMSIGSTHAAKFFSWFTAIALVLIVLSICDYPGLSLKGYIIALALILTSSVVAFSITNGKVDIYGGALGLAAYYWVFRIRHRGNALPIILTGLITGFACVAKFSNIPVLICGVGIIVVWNQWRTCGNNSYRIRHFLINSLIILILIGIGITIAMIPHLVKNWVLFREPFAPFFFLGGKGKHWTDQAWFSIENLRYILFTYPIAITFGRYPMQEGNLSALILAFMPMILLMPKPSSFKNSRFFQVAILALICMGVWILLCPSIIAPRYIMATFLLLVPVSAKTADYVLSRADIHRFLKSAICGGLFVVLLISVFQNTFFPLRFIKFLSGDISACEYASGYCPALEFVNSVAPNGSKIYLGGYHAYHLRPDLLQTISGPPTDLNWKVYRTNEQRWEYLYNQGFRFVIIQKATHSGILKYLDPNKTPSWMKVQSRYEDPYSIVYSLQPFGVQKVTPS